MSLAFAGLLAASPAQAAQSLPRQYQFLAILIEFPDEDMQDIHLDDADALEIQSMIAHEGGINKGQPYQGNREYPIVPMDQFFSKYSYGKINVNWSSWPRNAEGNVVSYTAPQSVRRYLPWSQKNRLC